MNTDKRLADVLATKEAKEAKEEREHTAEPAVDEQEEWLLSTKGGEWVNIYGSPSPPHMGDYRYATKLDAIEGAFRDGTLLGQCRVSEWQGVWPVVKEQAEVPRIERWVVTTRDGLTKTVFSRQEADQFLRQCSEGAWIAHLVEWRPEDVEPVATIEHRENDYARIVRLKDVSALPHGTKLYSAPPAPVPVKVETAARVTRLNKIVCKATELQDLTGVSWQEIVDRVK